MRTSAGDVPAEDELAFHGPEMNVDDLDVGDEVEGCLHPEIRGGEESESAGAMLV